MNTENDNKKGVGLFGQFTKIFSGILKTSEPKEEVNFTLVGEPKVESELPEEQKPEGDEDTPRA